MSNSVFKVSESLAQAGLRALENHAAPITDLHFALLSTQDGFEIASLRHSGELQASRLSAMSSSLMAMARAVGREIQTTTCKRLTFEAEGSVVVFQSIDGPAPCILCLVLGPDAVLGRALWAAGEVMQEMSRA